MTFEAFVFIDILHFGRLSLVFITLNWRTKKVNKKPSDFATNPPFKNWTKKQNPKFKENIEYWLMQKLFLGSCNYLFF